jgi:uncharacterized protein (TIGR03067 family)
MTVQGGDRDGTKTKGIYEVNGDDLKLCVTSRPGVERPREFSRNEDGLALITLRREKGK